jgi:hypothetical protein
MKDLLLLLPLSHLRHRAMGEEKEKALLTTSRHAEDKKKSYMHILWECYLRRHDGLLRLVLSFWYWGLNSGPYAHQVLYHLSHANSPHFFFFFFFAVLRFELWALSLLGRCSTT